jgi:hypothetical protein
MNNYLHLTHATSHQCNTARFYNLYKATTTETLDPLTFFNRVHKLDQLESCHLPPSLILSHQATNKVHYALSHTWADSTIQKYTGAVHQFLNFCDHKGVAAHYCLPASEFLLCAFTAADAGILSGNMAQNRISVVRAWHIASNAEWHGGLHLNYVLNGVENLTPPESHKPPCPPITRAMLNLLDKHLDHGNTLDICILAAAKTAFWGQCHLAEILSPTATCLPDITKSLLTLHSHLQLPCTTSGSHMLHLVQTKKGSQKGEDIILCKQQSPSDPIEVILLHLSINAIDDDLPIFSYITVLGIRFLTCTKLLMRCNQIWPSLVIWP